MNDWYTDLQEIQRLLDEAYINYFTKSDGHSKMSEGRVTVNFNTVFERTAYDESGTMRQTGGLAVDSVSVYSYVLGPERNHEFDSTADALTAVREWHAAEMARDYDEDDRLLPVEKLLNSLEES